MLAIEYRPVRWERDFAASFVTQGINDDIDPHLRVPAGELRGVLAEMGVTLP